MATSLQYPVAHGLLFLVFLTGCQGKAEANFQGVTVRDSVGIEIVESNAPLWAEATAWTIEPEPVLIIGDLEFDSTRALFRVDDVLLVDGDEAIVANGGTAELLWFNADGTLKKVIGKQGKGPGELQYVRGIWQCENGAIAVNDLVEIVQFDTAGQVVTSSSAKPLIGDGQWGITGINLSCSRVVVAAHPEPQHTNVSDVIAPTWSLAWQDLATGRRDTIAEFLGEEARGRVSRAWGRLVPQVVPWGNRPHYATAQNGFTYLASSASYETRRFTPSGDLTRISRLNERTLLRSRPARTVYEEQRRLMIEANPELSTLDDFIPKWGDFPVPDFEPVASDLLVDDEGHVWIRSYPRSTGGFSVMFEWDRLVEPESWTVFDPSGRWLGLVLIPPGVEIIRIQGDRLIGKLKDELDVEQIHIFQIRKPRPVGS